MDSWEGSDDATNKEPRCEDLIGGVLVDAGLSENQFLDWNRGSLGRCRVLRGGIVHGVNPHPPVRLILNLCYCRRVSRRGHQFASSHRNCLLQSSHEEYVAKKLSLWSVPSLACGKNPKLNKMASLRKIKQGLIKKGKSDIYRWKLLCENHHCVTVLGKKVGVVHTGVPISGGLSAWRG